MRRYAWEIALGTALIVMSAGLYVIQIRVFHAARDTLFYLFQDLAFVPIQVLLVTLILNQLLTIREKHAMLNKLNMVIGAFFSEMGTSLLKMFLALDSGLQTVGSGLLVSAEWTDQRFSIARRDLKHYEYRIVCSAEDLDGLRAFLTSKRGFLLRLLENQNLLEHERFTELLWAVSHLTEELTARADLSRSSPADMAHIAGDIKRAYEILILQWLAYMKHLKSDYPYLFSLAVRMNPFDPNASAEVR